MASGMDEKFCNACQTSKPIFQFGKDRWSKSGYTDYCKKCRNSRAIASAKKSGAYGRRNEKWKSYRSAYYKRPEVLDRLRNSWFQKSYGITLTEYKALLEKQGHKCAICRTPAGEGKSKRLHVDHCHSTKKVRGLLCSPCNRAIGLFQDDTVRMVKAIEYLQIGGVHELQPDAVH